MQQFDNMRSTYVSNDTCSHRGFDLLITYLLEGLPVLHIFSPLSVIPERNKHNSTEIEAIFEFAFSFLHDDAFILLFIPECKDVHTYSATYGFTLLRDWWGVNDMKLCSGTDAFAIVSIVFFSSTFSM